ncbi:MAG: hypothetical protein SOZ28_06255 [Clostridia bacterium]|nr:hypothetical protein [Clostridia bacterium]
MSISFSGAKKYKKHNGFSKSARIKTPLPSPIHFYSLHQGRNILLQPTVKKGERILLGQKIADLNSFDAIPVLSSVSGRVVSVTADMISVENDMLMDQYPYAPPDKSYDTLTTRELLWILRESAVCEVRSGIPVHVLLSCEKTPECVIVCCFDSDPYVSSPQAAAAGNAEKILKGLSIVLRILGIKKAVIGVENDTKKIYSDFKYHLRYNTDISLYSLKARYPQSRSDILVKTLTGKSIDAINTVILSSETLCNIANVLESGQPVTDKIVTVSGDDILPPNNYLVPTGAPIASLLTNSGYTSPSIVVNGGITDGRRITDLDEPITGITKAIIAFNNKNNIPRYAKIH